MSELQMYKYYDGRDNYMDTTRGKDDLQAILKEIDDERTLKENPKVLEIGCGSGMSIIVLKEMWLKAGNKSPLDIRGIDTNSFAVNMAKGRVSGVTVDNAEKLRFKNNEFDMVFGMYFIQEVDIEKVIIEALRVAKRAVFISESKPLKKLKRALREIPNETHKIKGLYKYFQYGNRKQVIITTIRKRLKAKAEIKSKEDEKDGISHNRNSDGTSS